MRPLVKSGARRGRGGFTLLELIVVIVLLVALAGLAMPGLLARVAGSTQDAVKVRLEAAAAVCRAEAQREGVAMELATRLIDGRTTVFSRPEAFDDHNSSSGEELLLELPPGYSVTEEDQNEKTVPGFNASEIAPVGGEVVLAVFQPDGSASAPGSRFVVFGLVVLEVRVARWTGVMTLSESGVAEPPESAEDAVGAMPPGMASEPPELPKKSVQPGTEAPR